MTMLARKCKCCGAKFQARAADVKRGWAKFCSKSCKAKDQERRTGQHAAYRNRRERDESDMPSFSNAHQFDNCES